MLPGFPGLQRIENRIVPETVREAGAAWILEISPMASPSPALDLPRLRCLVNADGIGWPVQAHFDALPFADESLPAVLVRHLHQSAFSTPLYEEIRRCLIPGGLLISVSASPWHPATWRVLGFRAARLPGPVRLQTLHLRMGLKPMQVGFESLSQLIPLASRLVLVASRKPPRPGSVHRLRFQRQPPRGAAAAINSWCRAA